MTRRRPEPAPSHDWRALASDAPQRLLSLPDAPPLGGGPESRSRRPLALSSGVEPLVLCLVRDGHGDPLAIVVVPNRPAARLYSADCRAWPSRFSRLPGGSRAPRERAAAERESTGLARRRVGIRVTDSAIHDCQLRRIPASSPAVTKWKGGGMHWGRSIVRTLAAALFVAGCGNAGAANIGSHRDWTWGKSASSTYAGTRAADGSVLLVSMKFHDYTQTVDFTAMLTSPCESERPSMVYRIDEYLYTTVVSCAASSTIRGMYNHSIGFPEHYAVVLPAMRAGREVEIRTGGRSFTFSLMGFTVAEQEAATEASRPVTVHSWRPPVQTRTPAPHHNPRPTASLSESRGPSQSCIAACGKSFGLCAGLCMGDPTCTESCAVTQSSCRKRC